MPKLATLPPKRTTAFVGCVQDLRNLLARLPQDVDGLEETYEVNHYEDRQTGEKWIEITPTK
jgi:hypothetical protein